MGLPHRKVIVRLVVVLALATLAGGVDLSLHSPAGMELELASSFHTYQECVRSPGPVVDCFKPCPEVHFEPVDCLGNYLQACQSISRRYWLARLLGLRRRLSVRWSKGDHDRVRTSEWRSGSNDSADGLLAEVALNVTADSAGVVAETRRFWVRLDGADHQWGKDPLKEVVG